MAKPNIIAFAGKARAGKSTAADFMVAAYGGYRYNFADPVYDMLEAIGMDFRQQFWQDHKNNIIPAIGKTPREMLQTLGTGWGRDMVNENLWVTLAQQRLLKLGPGMVISDVRHENEAQWVRKLGGLIIHVNHGKVEHTGDDHPSEAGIIRMPEDREIDNNGTLQDLQDQVKEILDGK
jgi:hypothetical protein